MSTTQTPAVAAIPTGDALFSYLPIGTILALAKLPAPLPTGWFICDGQNGTVDLIDRIPLGSVAGQVVTGPLAGARGTSTAMTTSGVEGSNAFTAGNPESYPSSNQHVHPLPVLRVYFVQRVN
jgi:hypothetical protein